MEPRHPSIAVTLHGVEMHQDFEQQSIDAYYQYFEQDERPVPVEEWPKYKKENRRIEQKITDEENARAKPEHRVRKPEFSRHL